MIEKMTDDELAKRYQTLEAQIERLHKDIEALLTAERMILEARRNIEDVATDLVTQQGAISDELQKRDAGKDPEALS